MTTTLRAPLAFGLAVDFQRDRLADRVDEQFVDVVDLVGRLAVDGDDEFALLDVDADLGQRRAQAAVPVGAVQDLGDLVVFRSPDRASARRRASPSGMRCTVRHVAAADVGVAGVQFADHFADDVGQVGAMLNVRQQQLRISCARAGQSTPCMPGS